MTRCGAIALCVLVIGASAAQATSVQNAAGPVSVNSGGGFRPIHGGASVQPGDVVMAGRHGRAEIVYDNGCRQILPANNSITIPFDPPCASGAEFSDHYILGAVAIAGIVAGAITLSGGDGHASSP